MALIKIIDDDNEFAQTIAATLRQAGHTVSIRTTAAKAVDDLVLNRPDLLILDVMFPENPAAGFELARDIRRKKSIADLPIILLTGANQEYSMDFSAADIDRNWMPVQDFVEKPVKPAALLKAVGRLLKRKK